MSLMSSRANIYFETDKLLAIFYILYSYSNNLLSTNFKFPIIQCGGIPFIC